MYIILTNLAGLVKKYIIPLFESADELWKVGCPPWYLVTNEPVHTVEAAWRVGLAYARHWQIEMALRDN